MKYKLLTFIVLSGFVFGQIVKSNDFFYSGFIIDINNDTVKCMIKHLGTKYNSVNCTYMPEGSTEILSFNPGEIVSYFVQNKKYISKEIKYENIDTICFANILVDGGLDLYNISLDDDYSYLIEDDSGKQFLINHKKVDLLKYEVTSLEARMILDRQYQSKYLGILKLLMNDYPLIHGRIETMNLDNKKSVVRLFVDYNKAVYSNKSNIDYTIKENKPNFYLGLNGSVGKTNLSFTGSTFWRYLSDAKREVEISYIYGVNFVFEAPSVSERLSLEIIIDKSKEQFSYYYNLDFESITQMEFDYFSYSLLLNYILIQKNINIVPFWGFSLINMQNYNEIIEIQAGYYRKPLVINNTFNTLNSGVKFNFQVVKRNDVYIELKAGHKILLGEISRSKTLGEFYYNMYAGISVLKRIN